MKKPNRIARKGDTAAKAAQAENQNQLPDLGYEIARFDDQRLYRNGAEFILLTEELEAAKGKPAGERALIHRIQPLTREQARRLAGRNDHRQNNPARIPARFWHRNGSKSPTAALSLGELLERDAIEELDKLAKEEIPIAAQVSGAVEAGCTMPST